ncbi:hypothetical protein HY639_03005 [Candidatus Woesearchaeota archaeon]|nr:hypothetical protein [Candidatus Woesearchaeota archaeon]
MLPTVAMKAVDNHSLGLVENVIDAACKAGEMKRYVVEVDGRYMTMESLLRRQEDGWSQPKKRDWKIRKGVRLYSEEECLHSPASQVPHFSPFHTLLDHLQTNARYNVTLEWDMNDEQEKSYVCLERLCADFDIQRITIVPSTIMPYAQRIHVPEGCVLGRLVLDYHAHFTHGQGNPLSLEGQVLHRYDQYGKATLLGDVDAFLQKLFDALG